LVAACTEVELVAHGAKQLQHNEVSDEIGEFKVGKPYKIKGVWYYPKVNYSYDETGIASWYGPGFHGRRTANGALFDENKVSGAHKTLQMPAIARVTNLENGRSIKVLINDRGPYAHGRIIDLSRRAAQLLDIERTGTARVRVQVLDQESRQVAALAQGQEAPAVAAAPTESVSVETLNSSSGQANGGSQPAPSETQVAAASNVVQEVVPASNQPVEQQPVAASQLYVQAGAFTLYDNANRLRARLSSMGQSQISPALVNGTQFFRVRIGPLASVQEADNTLERLIANGYPESRIVVD
jgi:rare lipoprotein A